MVGEIGVEGEVVAEAEVEVFCGEGGDVEADDETVAFCADAFNCAAAGCAGEVEVDVLLFVHEFVLPAKFEVREEARAGGREVFVAQTPGEAAREASRSLFADRHGGGSVLAVSVDGEPVVGQTRVGCVTPCAGAGVCDGEAFASFKAGGETEGVGAADVLSAKGRQVAGRVEVVRVEADVALEPASVGFGPAEIGEDAEGFEFDFALVVIEVGVALIVGDLEAVEGFLIGAAAIESDGDAVGSMLVAGGEGVAVLVALIVVDVEVGRPRRGGRIGFGSKRAGALGVGEGVEVVGELGVLRQVVDGDLLLVELRDGGGNLPVLRGGRALLAVLVEALGNDALIGGGLSVCELPHGGEV